MPGKKYSSSLQDQSLKTGAGLSLPLLVLLLAGTLFFYKESMLFSDCAHNLFRIINHNRLEIEASRYGIGISQFFPLMGERLHLPLRAIMMSYGASFYLFYLLVAVLLVFRYRNYGLAILLGLYVTMLVSESYYYLNNEGIPLLLLALALNFSIAKKKQPLAVILPVFLLSFFFALWTHPLVMIAAVYLWFFFLSDSETWPYTKAQTYLLTAILLSLSLVKFYQGMHHGYDSAKIEAITQFHPQMLLTIYKAPQFHFLARSFVTNYWLFSFLFIAGIGGALWQKRYFVSLLTVGFAAIYVLLLCITFYDADSRRFYLEIEYMPLTIICMTPFVYFVLPGLKGKSGIALLALIYCIRLAYIYEARAPFANRLTFLELMHSKMKDKNLTKVILTNPSEAANKTLIMNWGGPAESMLLSSLEGEQPQRTFIFLGADEIKTLPAGSKDTLIGCWELWPNARLNHNYFVIDTINSYHTMDLDRLME
jgi:hypothetical protein